MAKKKKSGVGRIVCAVLLVLLAAIIIVLAVNHKAVHAVWKNWTGGKLKLESLEHWDGGDCYMTVPYAKDSENQYVDIYVPKGTGAKPPLFVMIHGGGFVSNDSRSRQANLMLQYFRNKGYACASINYRLAQEAPFPGGLSDCKAAIRFLRLHADEYGYDASKFAVWGESAGGYLATMCAVTADGEFDDVRCIGEDEAEPVSSEPIALVDYYGHIDQIGDDADWKALGIPNIVFKIANGWITGTNTEGYDDIHSYWYRKNVSEMTEEELAVTDPYTYIEKNDLSRLSVYIIHGDCDITVPYLHSDRLYAAMCDKVGADNVRYVLVPGMGHAADMLYADDILEPIQTWLDGLLK